MALTLAALLLVVLALWTRRSMSSDKVDGRETIVFWGAQQMGDDIYAVVNQFEQLPQNRDPATGQPRYRVVLGNATTPDLTGDAQRLLCAVAGGVPPDVVYFDRFAIGEWASRGALENLLPYIKSQGPDDPNRLNLAEYYQWAIREASYSRPGSNDEPGIFGIPLAVDMRLLFCNSDLLRQEGLVDPATKEPKAPRTWEELREYANALTRYRKPNDKGSGITRLGFAPNFGNSWLYMYAWQAGGELMSPDRTRVTLDSPPVVRALRYMADVYDDLGGFAQVDGFQSGFQQGELDPFLQGKVAMKIDGFWSMEQVADWRPGMDFLLVPAPIPADRLAAGAKPITWGGGYSLVMPSTAHNKPGAWKLIQYVCSAPVQLQLEQGRREQKLSEGRLYLPRSVANRTVFEELLRRYVDGNDKLPPSFHQAFAVVRDMMPQTLYRPVTPVGQMLWNQHIKAYESGVAHVPRIRDRARREMAGKSPDEIASYEMKLALSEAQIPVQKTLDEILAPLPAETTVNWRPWFWLYGAMVVIPFIAMLVTYRIRRRLYSYKAREVGAAMLFASPWVIGFLVFVGGPIFFSVLFAFTRYNVLSSAHWVGLDNFRRIFQDELFYKSLLNTAFMILRIPLTMAASLMLAMLLNHAIRGMGFYRTACYMPAIVPVVAASLLWTWIFNPNQGILNAGIQWIFDTPPMQWLQRLFDTNFTVPLWLNDARWSKPALIVMSLWSAGGGMIIWLAGLQSIPKQLYEAAEIDGAGPWRRFWNVTVPMLSPYVLFNFIIGIIGTMQIFNEAFVMTQGGPQESTLFYAYHLFREAFQYFRMGYASALAWVLFVIVLALTLLQLWLSKKWVHYDRS